MVERIRTLLESRQLTPTQFADAIGVARPIVSHILSGRNKPSLEVVQRILAAMPDLAMPWLLNGTGEMLATPVATATPATASAPLEAPAPISAAPTTSAIAIPVAATPPVSAVAQNEAQSPVTSAPNPGNDVLQVADLSGKTLAQRANADVSAAQVVPNVLLHPAMPSVANSGSTNAPILPRTMVIPKRFTAASKVKSSLPGPVVVQSSVEPEPLPIPPVAAPSLATLPAAPTVTPPLPIDSPVAPADEPAASIPPEPTSVVNNSASPLASALFAGAEKPIRRIVIFYRDGSFADYQPE